MSKTWHSVFPAKSTIEQHMKRCTWQPLLTTDNMGNLHQMVVNDICQVVGRQFVGTLIKHLIVEDVALDDNIATNHIVYMHLDAWFDLEAYHILLAISDEFFNFCSIHGKRIAHRQTSTSIILEILNLIALSLKFLRSIKSDISLVIVKEHLYILLIYITTLALTVWSMFATEGNTFVKLDTEPTERLNDIVFGTRNETMRIGILNTEHQIATMLACKEIIIQCGTYTANMQRSCWTWCKTHSYFSF